MLIHEATMTDFEKIVKLKEALENEKKSLGEKKGILNKQASPYFGRDIFNTEAIQKTIKTHEKNIDFLVKEIDVLIYDFEKKERFFDAVEEEKKKLEEKIEEFDAVKEKVLSGEKDINDVYKGRTIILWD